MVLLVWEITVMVIMTFCLMFVTSIDTFHECEDGENYKELMAPSEDSAENHYITSPHYPGYYPRNTECGFRISTPLDNMLVHVDVVDIAIGDPSNCGHDSLYIYNGPSDKSYLLGKTCFNIVGYTSTSNTIYVKFIAGAEYSGNGFQVKYYYRKTRNSTRGIFGLSDGALAGICVAILFGILLKVVVVNRENVAKLFRTCKRRCCTSAVTNSNLPPSIALVEREGQSAVPSYHIPYPISMDEPPPYVYKNEALTDPPPSYEEAMMEVNQRPHPTASSNIGTAQNISVMTPPCVVRDECILGVNEG